MGHIQIKFAFHTDAKLYIFYFLKRIFPIRVIIKKEEVNDNMPALYAHNKFGKLVIPKLSDTMKNSIKKYPDAFRIGLQGPDFLFFYIFKIKLTRLGVDMHHQDTYYFIKHARSIIQKYGMNSPEYSYILGFICHFALDNNCHPYVNQFMKDTDCGHVEIEGDLEHYILTMDGHNPASYPMNQLVPVSKNAADCMVPFYPQLNKREIYHSLCMMRYMKKFFVAPGRIKRNLITFFMKATMHYRRLKGHIIMPYPNLKCRNQTEFLFKKLTDSVDEAVNLINNFTDSTFHGNALSGKFHRDFNGNYCHTD